MPLFKGNLSWTSVTASGTGFFHCPGEAVAADICNCQLQGRSEAARCGTVLKDVGLIWSNQHEHAGLLKIVSPMLRPENLLFQMTHLLLQAALFQLLSRRATCCFTEESVGVF